MPKTAPLADNSQQLSSQGAPTANGVSGGSLTAGTNLHASSFGGVSHPIRTDSRNNQTAAAGCSRGLLMEEVFTAIVK